jgi:DNA polymerase elongation subunit (family B)
MKYSREVVEYITVKLETMDNDTAIARDVIRRFKLDRTIEAVRIKVRTHRDHLNILRPPKQIKRLFFDIETSFCIGWFWRPRYKMSLTTDNIIENQKIICVSYKWQYDDHVHTLVWDSKQDDSKLVKEFIDVLGEADEIVAHNGDKFDIRELRTRAIKQGHLMFPTYRTLDTLKKARKFFSFNSNKLDYLGEYLELGRKLDHEGIDLWKKVILQKSKPDLKRMADYCQQDVILLEDVFNCLSPFIDHNTNFAVLTGGKKWECPHCTSDKVEMHRTDTTAMGWIRRFMKCKKCKKQYKISNKTYMAFLTKNVV